MNSVHKFIKISSESAFLHKLTPTKFRLNNTQLILKCCSQLFRHSSSLPEIFKKVGLLFFKFLMSTKWQFSENVRFANFGLKDMFRRTTCDDRKRSTRVYWLNSLLRWEENLSWKFYNFLAFFSHFADTLKIDFWEWWKRNLRNSAKCGFEGICIVR